VVFVRQVVRRYPTFCPTLRAHRLHGQRPHPTAFPCVSRRPFADGLERPGTASDPVTDSREDQQWSSSFRREIGSRVIDDGLPDSLAQAARLGLSALCLIKLSAGMPKRLCKPSIMRKVSGRFRASTS